MKRFLYGVALGAAIIGVAWWWDRVIRHWDDYENAQ